MCEDEKSKQNYKEEQRRGDPKTIEKSTPQSFPMEIAMADQEDGGAIQCDANAFRSVPEECIASMIALTTPPDACRLALVSKAFLAASESNFVWERFLPSDCDLIVSRSDGGEALLSEFQDRKKQLYLCLADRPLLVDGASKSFWLDKLSGKKCWMIAARSLGITWGDTPMYWKWTSIPESRFPEVAELLSVCWLDINVRIQTSTLSPGTQYAAYLVLRLTDDADGLEVVSDASVHIGGVEIGIRPVYIGSEYDQLEAPDEAMADQFPKLRTNGWRELKIGEFFTHPGEEDEVELAVREVRDLNWKRGLIVEGIEVRPARA